MRLAGFSLFLLMCLTLSLLGRDVRAQPHAPIAQVLVVSSDLGGAYDEVIAAFREEMGRRLPYADIRLVSAETEPTLAPHPSELILTLGLRAAELVDSASTHNRVVNALIPSYGFEHLQLNRTLSERERSTALFIDQPPERQIRLIRIALPNQREVAVIASHSSASLANELADQAIKHGMHPKRVDIQNRDEFFGAMRSLLGNRTALIAIPDRELYNPTTIQNILLTSFRMQSPVIGFSAAYVRAGALLAVYTRPDQVGTETAGLISDILQGHDLPPPAFPTLFEVGVNPTVSRSLGIPLESAPIIERKLRQFEEGTP